MKLSNRKTLLVGAAIALFGFAAFARDHNDMNGTWTLEPARSDFAGEPVLQTGTITISDHQGNTSVSRNFVYEGTTQTFFYSDSVGSEHNSTIHEGKDLKSKTTWDHDTLKVTTTQSGAVTVETYAVAPDGTMSVTVVRPDRHPITLYFRRQ